MRDVATIEALLAGDHRGAVLVEVDFGAAGAARWSTLPATITWQAVPWRGAGDVLAIGEVADQGSGRADGVGLTLSGVASGAELVALALAGDWPGATARLYYAVLDARGQVVGALRLRTGKIHAVNIDDDGDRCTIATTIETAALDGRLAADTMMTDASQRTRHPADTIFRGFAAALDLKVKWGGVA